MLWCVDVLFKTIIKIHWNVFSGVKPVTFTDWEKIDQAEILLGEKAGKPREKIVSIKEMIRVASSEWCGNRGVSAFIHSDLGKHGFTYCTVLHGTSITTSSQWRRNSTVSMHLAILSWDTLRLGTAQFYLVHYRYNFICTLQYQHHIHVSSLSFSPWETKRLGTAQYWLACFIAVWNT